MNPTLSAGYDDTISATDIIPVTPDNDADLQDHNGSDVMARAIRCKPTGTAGTLRITTSTGEVRNTAIAVGEVLTVLTTRVHSTGTTADGLEAML